MAGSFSFKAWFADPWATRLVLASAFVLHYVLGAAVGLSVDEAHYALYATHLALSYFDHPPLVGWVQWPLVALNAPVEVLRWIPELLWLGTALLVFQIAERLQALTPGTRPRSGRWFLGRAGDGAGAAIARAGHRPAARYPFDVFHRAVDVADPGADGPRVRQPAPHAGCGWAWCWAWRA